MSTYALAVVDMQKAYFDAGDLKNREGDLVAAINPLLEVARHRGVPIFNVVTLHARDQSTWTLNMLDDKKGYLFKDDQGAQQVDGMKLDGVTMLTKTRDSAFFQTPLAMQLKAASVETLILVGVSTHSCIYQTAADAYAHNIRVIVAKDAVASHDKSRHESALEILSQEYRQAIFGNREIIELLEDSQAV